MVRHQFLELSMISNLMLMIVVMLVSKFISFEHHLSRRLTSGN